MKFGLGHLFVISNVVSEGYKTGLELFRLQSLVA